MIRIARPEQGPQSLREKGEKQTESDCDDYDDCPDDYRTGRKRFKPRPTSRPHYSKPDVKQLLVRVHHSKCCYCEKRYRSVACLQIEHFRPKLGVRQTSAQEGDWLPGYYWLMYRWDNLLLSCAECNNRKGTVFPLTQPADRARSHHDDISQESALLLDPVQQEPRDHIRFSDDRPIGISCEGKVTIRSIGLDRKTLESDRLDALILIKTLLNLIKLADGKPGLEETAAEARERVEKSMRPAAEFSSMAIDYVAGHEL